MSQSGGVHKVYVGDEEHLAKSVILAMGAEPKKLGVPGEDELAARGVSYCATCDASFFRDKPTVVVGGGDTAMEDATFLAKFAKDVKIVNRRDEFRASAIMLDRARQAENIELVTPFTVARFEAGADGSLERVVLDNAGDGEDRTIDIGGAFIAIGHRPRTSWKARSTWTRTATWRSRDAPRGPTPACSPRVTWSTAPTARPSPQRAPAVPRRSMLRRTYADASDPEAHWAAPVAGSRGCRGPGAAS